MPSLRRLFPALVALGLSVLPGLAGASTQIPLDPNLVPKFVDPLPIPGVLDGRVTTAASPLVITASEFQQRCLPASMYPSAFAAGSYVWGYNGTYPGPTIVAQRGIPTHVKYINNLQHSDGSPLFLQENLQVDQTLHWADPLGTGLSTDLYTGPVPICVHLHGGEMPSAFDGGPDEWFTPNKTYKGSAFVSDQYVYTNEQEGTALFYHDHALGMTSLNVFAGMAAFYLILDPSAEAVTLPGSAGDNAADMYGHGYMMGMALQDKSWDTDGQEWFDHVGFNPEHPRWQPEYFGNTIVVNGKTWPYLDVEPRRYRFRIVNGCTARFFHMRLADGVGAGPKFWQIGSDGGMLEHPAILSDHDDPNSLLLTMAPGERSDIVIDFSGFANDSIELTNDANTPFPGGDPVDANTSVCMQFRVGHTVTGGVDPTEALHLTTSLRTQPIERPTPGAQTRALTLNEMQGPGGPLGVIVNNSMWSLPTSENPRVGDTEVWEIVNLTGDTHPMHLHLLQTQMLNRQAFDIAGYLTEYGAPTEGNGPPLNPSFATTATGGKLGGNPDVTPFLIGSPTPPDANETGWKDVWRVNPGEVTRIVVRVAPQDGAARAAAMGQVLAAGVNTFPFEPWMPMGMTDSFGLPGGQGYVWHCHITDHEDNEMMRRLTITGPSIATATLVARFDAVPQQDGMHVNWELTSVADIADVTLERAQQQVGPWEAVDTSVPAGRTAMSFVDASPVSGSVWYRLRLVNTTGAATTFGPIQASAPAGLKFALGAVSPNPTKAAVHADFSVGRDARVRISVLDVQGREVIRLADGPYRAGQYSLNWDGGTAHGKVAAGLYFLRYSTPGFEATRRVILTP